METLTERLETWEDRMHEKFMLDEVQVILYEIVYCLVFQLIGYDLIEDLEYRLQLQWISLNFCCTWIFILTLFQIV